MVKLLKWMGPDKIAELVRKDGNIAETFNYLSQYLLQGVQK
jgi:hypothetical protein